MFIKKEVKLLLENIKNHPDDWKMDYYTAKNDKVGLEIWIANGVFFCKPYEKLSNWNLFEKFLIYSALKSIMGGIYIEKLEKANQAS